MTVSITDYDADPSGSRLSTDAIQAAIDAVANAGGGTAVVPPGTYLFGTVTLRSHVELHLEPGAMLLASPNINDFVNEPEGVAPPEFKTAYCPFIGIDIENVSVTGTGAIDFRGRDYNHYETPLYGELFTAEAHAAMPERRRNEFAGVPGRPRPAFMFFFLRCRNIRFSDITIRDAACWTFRISLCDTVRLRGLNIQNHLRAINSDGINIGSSSNITVSDCTIVAGDDCIAINNESEEGRDCSNVTITNCVLVSYSCGVRIGYKGPGAVERVAISNCVITGSNRGIGIFAGESSRVSDVVVSNLVIETHLIAGHWWGKGEPLAFLIIGDDGVI
ncbi:MAG: right-handed parallel beta-helix repeat-containing protein, partial [Spirochaetaceae bacterium]|nr:right-handed parallel beta-helix repeat-containing protein [Spirochaetaceae bacterium]